MELEWDGLKALQGSWGREPLKPHTHGCDHEDHKLAHKTNHKT